MVNCRRMAAIRCCEAFECGEMGRLKKLCRLLDLPAPDQEPKHEDQLPEKRDKDESKMGVRIRVWPQAIDHPAQSIDCQQNPDYSW